MTFVTFDKRLTRDQLQKINRYPYSVQYHKSIDRYGYEIISYGFHHLDPYIFLLGTELDEAQLYRKLELQLDCSYKDITLDSKTDPVLLESFKSTLNLYNKLEYFSCELDGYSIKNITPKLKLEDYKGCRVQYCGAILVYILGVLDIKHKNPFRETVYLDLELSGLIPHLNKQKDRLTKLYSVDGSIFPLKKIPSIYRCVSDFESLLYYLESRSVVTETKPKFQFKKTPDYNFILKVLDCLEFPCYVFNNLNNEKGIELLNPLGSNITYFNPLRVEEFNFKRLPSKGYTVTSRRVFMWSKLRNNATHLRAIKKAVLSSFKTSYFQKKELVKDCLVNNIILNDKIIGKCIKNRKGFYIYLKRSL
jgi:hypothetical protein